MRFLHPAVREQIRLGWLPVIASVVGSGRRELTRLQHDLLPFGRAFPRWAEAAGLSGGPQGNIQPTRADRLVRMAVTYGIYDEETGALTDLGHVLRHVAPWGPAAQTSPLIWQGSKRWVGLRMVMAAAGDVLLPLLRRWSRETLDGAELTRLLVEVLRELERHASPEQRALLAKQAERGTKEHGGARERLVYPYLEPLRDLDYLAHKSEGGSFSYGLTPAGKHLREALLDIEGNADALLTRGLSQIFLRAEHISPLYPSSGRILARVLADLPEELTVSEGEAPFEAMVILAQARLVDEEPGAWIDPELAHTLIQRVGARCAGKVSLKRGQSILELNVAWTERALLTDESLWACA